MPREPRRVDGYAPIRDYAAIGDERSIALVALDGTIDWLCLPCLDAPPVFSALLDSRRGGRFELAPDAPFSAERRYLPDTNVLETTFTTSEGVVRVTDALAIAHSQPLPWQELARRVECLSGSVPVRWRIAPRGGWSLDLLEIDGAPEAPVLRHRALALLTLAWGVGEPLAADGAVGARAQLEAGERALLALCAFDGSPLLHSGRDAVERRIDETVDHWRRWSSGGLYDGPWADAVVRSALALQLLVYAPTGAMAAAGTGSLPESIGGDRNWDYRYAWLRDTAFALEAMLNLGRRDQVHTSLAFTLRASAVTHPRLHAFYGLDGGTGRPRAEALGLSGYRDSRPVVVGNAAAHQRQLGNYGDLLQTVWLYVLDGNSLDPGTAVRLAELADFVVAIWHRPDASIWELADYRDFMQGKLAAWLALDRGARLADRGAIPARGAARWRREAERVRRHIEAVHWSPQLGAYRRDGSADELDAAALMAARPTVAFLERGNPRIRRVVDALRQQLGRGPLMYRYSGVQEREGAFLACSFWLVEALAHAGSREDAAALMDELVTLGNDVGLYSEQIDPDSGEMLGNFPQALTHLSLINAAQALRG